MKRMCCCITISCHIESWEFSEVSALEALLIPVHAPHDSRPGLPENLRHRSEMEWPLGSLNHRLKGWEHHPMLSKTADVNLTRYPSASPSNSSPCSLRMAGWTPKNGHVYIEMTLILVRSCFNSVIETELTEGEFKETHGRSRLQWCSSWKRGQNMSTLPKQQSLTYQLLSEHWCRHFIQAISRLMLISSQLEGFLGNFGSASLVSMRLG